MKKAVDYSSELAQAIALEAEHTCQLALNRYEGLEAEHFLRAMPLTFPFLSALGVCLRYGEWRSAGILQKLPVEHLRELEAAIYKFALCVKHSNCCPGDLDAPGRELFTIWLRNFAWYAREELGIDLILQVNSDVMSALEVELTTVLSVTNE